MKKLKRLSLTDEINRDAKQVEEEMQLCLYSCAEV